MTRFEFYGNLNKYHDNNSLSHKQSPLYGKQNPNAKYYKRIGEPGNYTYYYTKEEYDAAHRQGNAQTDAQNSMAGYNEFKKQQAQKKVAEDRNNMSGYNDWKKQQEENIRKNREEISKKNDTGREAAIKAGQKSEQNRQKLEEAKKNVNKEIDELHNNANDNVYTGKDLSNALKRNLNQDKIDDLGSELGGILTEYYKVIDNNDDSDEGSKLKRKAWNEYFNKRDKIFEKYGIEFGSKEYTDALKVSEEIEKEYEKKHKYDTSADATIKKIIKEKEYNKKK